MSGDASGSHRITASGVVVPPGLQVLLVEDNPADAELSTEAIAETGQPASLHVAASGELAIERLRAGIAGDVPLPDIVLLDLNLPGLDGHRVLTWAREQPALRDIPIVILSSSADASDVANAYEAGASGYVQKPMGFDALREKLDIVLRYWRDIVLRSPSDG
jgi:two-component system, chemotaxis family, response regulator Rcp1